MKLPNFLVAGFPKCGSTSLYYYLYEHPEIYLPKQKELHFFTYDIISKQDKGKADKEIKKFHIGSLPKYKLLFEDVEDEKIIGDVSPSYANYAEAIPKIKEVLGADTKIIIIVRDPIKRAYSNYLHLVREDRETLPFYEALQAEAERREQQYSDFWYYAFNSMYYEKIKRMKAHFSNVQIITFEEFIKNPQHGMQAVYSFLGADPSFKTDTVDTQFNPGGTYKKNTLTNFIFKQSKAKNILKKTLPITTSLKKLKIKLINKYKEQTPPIDPKAEAYLIALFKDDVAKLKRDFNVKTEYWNDAFQA